MSQPKPSKPRTVSCPQCGSAVVWAPQSLFRPFCSERCKLIDIGAWASEQYCVAGQDEVPSDVGQDEV